MLGVRGPLPLGATFPTPRSSCTCGRQDTRDDGDGGNPIDTRRTALPTDGLSGTDDGGGAWLTLYRELGERVFRLVHRMTGDEDTARDLTHDTFVRVFERSDQYAGTGARSSWVFQIAVNLVRQRARTHRRRAELLERESPVFERSAPDDARRVESRMVLDRALERISEDQRATLLLYEVDGYSHGEIAEMLGIAEGSSKARVSRAKAALREALRGRI